MLYRGLLGTNYSGSIAAITAGHCANSLYFRARSIPTNPNSSRQQAIREAVDQARTNWQALDPTIRDQWEAFAAGLRRPNRIGNKAPRTGFNEYVRWATPRLFANSIFALGLTADVCSPVLPEASFIVPPTAAIVADALQITLNPGEPWASDSQNCVILWVSAARASTDPPAYRILAPTVNYFRGPWRLAATFQATGFFPAPPQISVTLPAAPTTGQSVRWKIHLSTLNNGYSAEYQGATYA